ncbi:MAG: YidC/Oxa1 family insertase periplasmic-domain containing protein, partial [Planctomycetota bacterium]|nr:YidC/Oxa1 family insertase periplasmic-domain containing protein [Planctomycetota bacterium]
MAPEGKRTLLATMLCIGVMVLWFKVYAYMYPTQPEPAATQPAATVDDGPTLGSEIVEGDDLTESEPDERGSPESDVPVHGKYYVADPGPPETVTLGLDEQNRDGFENPYEMQLDLSSLHASLESVTLSRHRGHVAKDKNDPDHDPYLLLQPVTDPKTEARFTSFCSEQVTIDDEPVSLKGVHWNLEEPDEVDGMSATFSVIIEERSVNPDEPGSPKVLLRKTYRLKKGSSEFELDCEIVNLSSTPLDVGLGLSGPIGVRQEDLRYDYRRVVAAIADGDGLVDLGEKPTHGDVFKSEEDGKSGFMILRPGEDQRTVWTAVGNKYFTVILAPRDGSQTSGSLGGFAKVTAVTRFGETNAADDLTFECVLEADQAVEPNGTTKFALDAYCGPKNKELKAVSPKRDYYIVTLADRTFCNIEAISTAMLWLLTKLQLVFGNFGISIIVLVIIVKLMLHPISKRGQMHMMRSQKKMAQVKPKLDALQKQFKNDKQKLQQEQMRLYREEGVNPAGTIFGCLPMMLQMPIWVALWTTLNTNVDMRHQSFFWWIRDLSAPDSLIAFSGSYSIPLIGSLIGSITAFNLLPLIMTISMYSQQKLTQKLTKPDKPVKPAFDAEGRPVVDQMAQQQKMMSFMMLFMGVIFYNFPSGLNLYILTSNLLGMLEQYQIRTKIREQEARGDFDVKSKPKDGGGGGGRGPGRGVPNRVKR